MATYRGKLFIDGKWVNSKSGKTFKSYNPATEKVLGTFQQGNEKDVELAVKAAEKAFPAWGDTPAPERAQILREVARIIKENIDHYSKCVTDEMGKVLKEGRSDVQEAIDTFEYFDGEGRRLFGHTTPSELRQKFAMTIRMPLGVVGLISPWNFPIAIPAWKLAPALVCGNTIIFKPSSDTPMCATEIVKVLEKAGVPKGVVNLVTGPGRSVGKCIVEHPKTRGISFTGSKGTGDWILKNAGIKKVGLELGGKNLIIIMDDADLDLALDGVIWGAFGTTGQRCTAASRLIIHEKVKSKFEKMLVKAVNKLKLGYGGDKKTDVGPLINKDAVEKSFRYVSIGKKEGAKLLCGGSAPSGKGHFFKPTVFTEVKPNMKIAQEEIFGPVLAILSVKSLAQAIKVANGVEYGLSSSIYTKDMTNAFEAIQKIEAGITYVNSSTIGSEVHLPFGGVKSTGNGVREAGIFGVEEFSEIKTVYIDYSGNLQKAQWDE